jgi:hypothetical protein
MAKVSPTPGKLTIHDLAKVHAENSPNDGRVKKDPVTGKFKGQFWDPGDPFHKHVLSLLSDEEKSMLSRAERAIAKRGIMYLTHKTAEANAALAASRASRTAEYAASPEREQLSGHGILPTDIGVSLPKKPGEKARPYIDGLSASVIASNAQKINDNLPDTRYPDLDHPKFGADLHGYIQNLKNGWMGDGSAAIKSTDEHPVKKTDGYEPYKMEAEEADFLNAILHNVGAKQKGALRAKAHAVSKAHTGLLSEEGETNPIRHKIDNMENPKRMYYPGMPEKPEQSWSDEMLESPYKHFNTDQIVAIHDNPREMAESIRPPTGTERVHQAYRQGTPPSELVAGHPRRGEPPGPGEKLAA